MLEVKKSLAQRVALMGVLSAISIVLVALIRIPIFAGAPYLLYDMADIPILFGAFLLGAGGGLEILVVVSAIQAIFLSPDGFVGFVMHVCASGVLVIVATVIYRYFGKNVKSMVIGLICGSLAMTIMMIPLNYLITSWYLGVPRQAVTEALLPFIIPFNLIKAGLNSAITFVLYGAISFAFAKNSQPLKQE